MRELLFILLAAITTTQSAEFEWSYRDQGLWTEQCTQGLSQSPIDIRTRTAIQKDLGKFKFTNYILKPDVQTMTNDGHSVKVDFKRPIAFISGGDLPAHFMFLQYHFHWGPTDDTGSEHLLNGVRSPLELHLVHWNTRYGSLEKAIMEPDGLAVLGVMYEISAGDNPALDPIVGHLADVADSESKYNVYDLPPLNELLPSDRSRYYRYSGSLTTPTCNEAVIWTVFEEKQKVSVRQLDAFRGLRARSGRSLDYNFREEQPLNGRKVYRSGPLFSQKQYYFTKLKRKPVRQNLSLAFLYQILCANDQRYCLSSSYRN